MTKTKILIAVKTYPTISKKYEELVCTAGFREDGSWIRIYPFQFRKRAYADQFKKYEWIEIDLVKNPKDFRPESYRPVSHDTEVIHLGEIPTDGDTWKERRKIVLKNVYTNLTQLIAEAKDKNICTSLAVFKPTKVIDFVWEEVEREWDKAKLEQFKQYNIFQAADEKRFEPVKKLPYKFSFLFEDCQGTKSKTMIEDWEVGELYWNCLKKHDGDEQKACQDVKNKYFNNFAKTKDLHFYMGTSQMFHFTGKNPFLIIGAFYPKKIEQLSLFE